LAGKDQHQDTGARMIHLAPDTHSRIVSKSISKDGGRSSFRGDIRIAKNASGCSSSSVCDALILDPESRSDTYPSLRTDASDARLAHEATVERIDGEKLFYLASRGIGADAAQGLLVNGFIEPIAKEIPMEYSIELSRLINLEMERPERKQETDN
ncbi:MAG: Fe-S cluster assembly protein SufB, partial [Candidatus Moranbacteria bacterium]|nr:Fe-S cluster assembly protein SufB [Candidatus Moranbacteria bacterium]